GDARTLLRAEHRTLRTIRGGRARQVRDMRLLPLARLVVFGGRRRIVPVMQPAVPAGRHSRGFGIAVVDHPAARIALIILAALVIDVSRLVGADLLAVPPRIEARIEVLAVPPGKYLRENGLHRFLRQDSRRQGRY